MTSKLLQVLSHPIKLEILRTITTQPEPVETIAQKVDISPEETKVHLDSLHGAGLVDKEPDGKYRDAPLGQLTLSLLIDLDFVAANYDCFRDLDLSLLPISFVERLGELKDSERIEGAVTNIQNAEKMFSRAEKKISVIANEVMLDAVPIVREKVSKGADFRFIIDQTFKPPKDFKSTLPQLWRKIWKIPAATVVTDNEAMVFFLDRKLKVDYSIGFVSKEPAFIKWCEELVDYLWDQGDLVESE
ncbi:MAG: helix-turn-helix domain-containing protein [Thermoplasmata archaeon]|nr:MAG: helix-turn-helix domain-containing protein [Thermoplasmata archaeon]